MTRSASRRGRAPRVSFRTSRTGSSRPGRGLTSTRPRAGVAITPREGVVLGLLLVERLSLVEAALALGSTPAQVRRDYDTAVLRVRRALAPFVDRAHGLAPGRALRRAS